MANDPVFPIEGLIHVIRGHRVILSADLAQIYGVEPKALNQAVKRNLDRFPPDFAFRLTRVESEESGRPRSQIVTLKRGANIKYPPLAFTEHGAIMAASILASPRAVQMSIFVVRAFLRLREWVIDREDLSEQLARLEARVSSHDADLAAILRAVRELIQPPERPRRRIGFTQRSK